jgi:hypothetical protein
MEFESKSQAGQDEFVYRILGISNGTFFDVGSHTPIEINNTYALEKVGWSGYLFDINSGLVEETKKTRLSPFTLADMTTFDWNTFLETNNLVNIRIDYLSFDIDEASLVSLRRFPFDKVSFNVCTIEHDRYRFGQPVADEIREILQQNGYHMVCKDVSNVGNPFEDWYVHASVQERLQLPLYNSLEWTAVLKSIRNSYSNTSADAPSQP